MGEFSIERFEADCRENGIRFWYAHVFMVSLGYDNWASFQKVITKAMGSCARLGIDPTEAFSRATCVEDDKEVTTYKLSRFACFLVSMHADSAKPEVAKAKAVLAGIAAQLVEERIAETDLGRIETREDLKAAERQLAGAVKDAGLQSGLDYAVFKDAGFRGMYNMSLDQLKRRKGVDGSATLYDFMQLEELAGNLFRVTQTSVRVRSKGIRGLPALKQVAHSVGHEVRGIMIKNGGTAPESLAVGENINTVQRRLKSANRAMSKMDVPPKRKSLPKPTTPQA
jgi:DNA-damage-inducible protein D